MTITAATMVADDIYLENQGKDDWQLVLVGEDKQPLRVTIPDASALCSLIHRLTHMVPFQRLKEEDKQELIWAMEQIIPMVYRNYVLDEYVLD
jgi:hypothetical protein